MLVLPMRSQDPSPSRPQKDVYPQHLPSRHREASPQTSELRKQVAGAMLSAMPQTRPPPPKRPKLSLQTSIPQMLPPQRRGDLLNTLSTDSPTTRNTNANTFDHPPPTPSSVAGPSVSFPPSSSTSSSSSESPQFANQIPYTLPIGTHSILRNSPLPPRHISAAAASVRQPRRMFPPVKQVCFREQRLTETIPIPSLEISHEIEAEGEEVGGEGDVPNTEEEQQRRREEIQAEDGHATPTHYRRKRRREWIWRPVEDDVLMGHGFDIGNGLNSPASIPLPESATRDEDVCKEDCDASSQETSQTFETARQ
ncbi:hypothetical protein ACLMJK_005373 [Lecanora helva]